MRVTAEINLQALQHNLKVVKQKVPGAKILAMVKANAYGHGLVLCANNLEADFLGIASLIEAQRLREAGITKRIVFMPGIQHQEDFNALRELDLDTVIYDARQIDLLAQNITQDKIRVWFKIDTGMHRLGCAMDQAEILLKRLEALPHVEIVCVMSHLACADLLEHTLNKMQFERFAMLTQTWAYPRSILNSAGILNFPEYQYDIVRPGLMLYGASPTAHLSIDAIGLQPVMALSAKIFAIDSLSTGDSVGYGAVWTATRPSRIAIISIGYGDGYPQLANQAMVLIQSQLCPVVGRVSMDFTAVDITDLPQAIIGDTVLLWGCALPANDVATAMQASVYRLLTGVMERVPRYIKNSH